ncbi:MAG TPA: SAM-dependent methyltransferase, partial [Ktedonobacterales bacterium]|nr:SAM-dependent methyltransferase [Ktedonobacterales bacterium]
MPATPLEVLIHEEIARAGPLTFARFMELALYHPALGYYAGGGSGREPIGWDGDYVTSGDVHPLWGWCIARQLREMWDLLDRPPVFQVVEVGGGRGLLARDVLAYARDHAPDWLAALR